MQESALLLKSLMKVMQATRHKFVVEQLHFCSFSEYYFKQLPDIRYVPGVYMLWQGLLVAIHARRQLSWGLLILPFMSELCDVCK